MRVFVTGASGWIGSAVVPELLDAGHTVLGLARSEASAERLAALGADVHRGDLDDLDSLRAGAADADAVIHLAYVHDFTRITDAAATDRRAIDAFVDELADSDRALVIASGTAGLTGTELAEPPADHPHPRFATAKAVVAAADRGVRTSVVRLPPTVHGAGDHGFVAALVAIAREKGRSGYPGDGSNRWQAVHRSDAARVFRLAVERAPAGSIWHAVAEDGVPVREIATVIGRHLGLPVGPVEDPEAHFGWMARFLAMDGAVSSAITRERLGWDPTGPTLLEDLDSGSYFA